MRRCRGARPCTRRPTPTDRTPPRPPRQAIPSDNRDAGERSDPHQSTPLSMAPPLSWAVAAVAAAARHGVDTLPIEAFQRIRCRGPRIAAHGELPSGRPEPCGELGLVQETNDRPRAARLVLGDEDVALGRDVAP